MNKKGTSSVLFLFLIPLILVLVIIIVDTLIGYTENNAFKNVTEKIITKVYNDKDILEEDYFSEIKKLYEKKGYETDSLVVMNEYNGIYIENVHHYFGLFTSLKKSSGYTEDTKIFGVNFTKKKNSIAFIKVKVSKDIINKKDNKLKFEYEK